MAVPLATRRRILTFALETTAGTAESVGSSAIHVEDVEFTPDATFQEFAGTIYGGMRGGSDGPRSASVSFTVQCTTTGSTTAPAWFALLQACAIIEAAGVWSPTSSTPGASSSRPQKTITIGFNSDGRHQQIAGAVGNVVFNFTPGNVLTARFTFTGKRTKHSAVALPTPTWPSGEVPLRAASGAVAIAGYAVVLGDTTIDFGNATMLIPSIADATGYLHGVVTDRRVTGTLVVSAEAVSSDYAPQTWRETAATKATVITIGTGAGRLIITMAAMQIINPQEQDRDGNLADALEFVAMRSNSGDDEITLSWGGA